MTSAMTEYTDIIDVIKRAAWQQLDLKIMQMTITCCLKGFPFSLHQLLSILSW